MKKGYDEIEIPDELSGMMDQVRKRAGKRNAARRKMAGTAMVFAAVLLTSNIPSVYGALLEVPVLGSVVQVFHVGTGGTATDGTELKAMGNEESLNLYFQKRDSADQTEKTPAYKVERLEAPDRLVITVYGVRKFDPETWIREAEASSYVKTAYREMILDDSAVRLVLELQPDTGFEVTEYEEPGGLQIRMFYNENQEREVWFLRSEKMDMTEGLALLAERLSHVNGTIAETRDDKYIVSIGAFESREEAEKRLSDLTEQGILDGSFTVDYCLSSERPE